LVEERIREAQERGEFANIGGPGKALDLSGDTSDPHWMANRALKNSGFLPPALDMGREIDEARAAAAVALARIRRRRAYLLEGGTPPDADRARFNTARAKAIDAHRAALKSINDRILALNLSAPAALHRRSIPIEREIEAFERECPLL
jgi:hypothetical protein